MTPRPVCCLELVSGFHADDPVGGGTNFIVTKISVINFDGTDIFNIRKIVQSYILSSIPRT